MFARGTKLFGVSAALVSIVGSLALAQNFSAPGSSPQFIAPQGDPPPLLNQNSGQVNGQYNDQLNGGQFNGPSPADSAPRLDQRSPQSQPQPYQPQFGYVQPPSQARPQAPFGNPQACQWDHNFGGVCGYDPAVQHRFAEPPMPAGFHCQDGYCPLDASGGGFHPSNGGF